MNFTYDITFTQWIEKNRDHFKDYNAYEISQVASACGFKLSEICPSASEWITASQRRLRLWTSPFYCKWIMATKAQNGIE